MKAFIIIILVFFLYLIPVKDIYDEKMFLTEDVKILENEIGQKDSIIIKLQYDNAKLTQKIQEMVEVKKVKKPVIKPVVKKQDPAIEVIIPVITDTIK